jgi:hypothetical protein
MVGMSTSDMRTGNVIKEWAANLAARTLEPVKVSPGR